MLVVAGCFAIVGLGFGIVLVPLVVETAEGFRVSGLLTAACAVAELTGAVAGFAAAFASTTGFTGFACAFFHRGLDTAFFAAALGSSFFSDN